MKSAKLRSLVTAAYEHAAGSILCHHGRSPILKVSGQMIQESGTCSQTYLHEVASELFSDAEIKACPYGGRLEGLRKLDGKAYQVACDLGTRFELQSICLKPLRPYPCSAAQVVAERLLPMLTTALTDRKGGLIVVASAPLQGKSSLAHELTSRLEFPFEVLEIREPATQELLKAISADEPLERAFRDPAQGFLLESLGTQQAVKLLVHLLKRKVPVVATIDATSAGGAAGRLALLHPEPDKMCGILADELRAVFYLELVPAQPADEIESLLEAVIVGKRERSWLRRGEPRRLGRPMPTGSTAQIDFDESLLQAIEDGKLGLDEAIRLARDPQRLRALLSGIEYFAAPRRY